MPDGGDGGARLARDTPRADHALLALASALSNYGSVRYQDSQGVEGVLSGGQSVRLPVPPPSESVAPVAVAPSAAPL